MSKIKKSIIGLTGGIATGKSTALLQLKKCGAEVIDSDSISRNLLHTQ
jgi:dephospho-CoA kinase